jgi:hypothetical protein
MPDIRHDVQEAAPDGDASGRPHPAQRRGETWGETGVRIGSVLAMAAAGMSLSNGQKARVNDPAFAATLVPQTT